MFYHWHWRRAVRTDPRLLQDRLLSRVATQRDHRRTYAAPAGGRAALLTSRDEFMASLTETTFEAQGKTVLYLPSNTIEDVNVAAKNKDLVQQLESVVVRVCARARARRSRDPTVSWPQRAAAVSLSSIGVVARAAVVPASALVAVVAGVDRQRPRSLALVARARGADARPLPASLALLSSRPLIDAG